MFVIAFVLGVVMFIGGILFLANKQHWTYISGIDNPRPLATKERLVVGFALLAIGVSFLATLFGMFVVGNPHWFVDHLFGLFQ